MATPQDSGPTKGWGWLRQVQNTTQQLGQICTEGVGEAKRRLEENRPGIDQFVKNIGDNMQHGVKKVQEQQPGFDQLVRNIGDNVQKGVKNIQENLARDPWSSPPTAAEIASLDLVYVNDRVIAMGFPVDRRPPSAVAGAGGDAGGAPPARAAPVGVRAGNDMDLVAALLRSRHSGHYMVWNVSEEGYDYSLFQDQVLEFRFPGHPAPPLGMLFKMCTSIESWLLADPKNIAAVHCLTGRGRTSTVLACYLAWVGEVSTPGEALEHVASCKGVAMERLTIPSQRRYISYFSSVMEGVRPRSEPLLLRRVIMNTIPTFGTKNGGVIGPGKGAAAKAEEEAVAAGGEGEGGALGCCPYIQVFKGGALIFTATYRASQGLANVSSGGDGGEGDASSAAEDGGGGGGDGDELPWAYTSDDSISFPVDCVLQGDLLVRCRHLSPNGRRVSMFRAAFHTGYVPCGVLRLTKQQLDGACADDRFHQDFFLDLIFAPVESTTSSPSKDEAEEETAAGDDGATVEASETAPVGEAAESAEGEPVAAGAAASENAAAASSGNPDEAAKEAEAENSAVARREGGLVVDAEAGEAFDSMLHRDARFWGEIAARKERRAALLKEREEARARGESPKSAIDTARAKAIKQKEAAAAAAAAGAGGTRFSIDEDEASQASRSRWGLNPAASAAAPDASASSSTKPSGGITDDDLLAQLAEAEMGQDDFLGGGGDSGAPAGSSFSAAGGTGAGPPAAPSTAGSGKVAAAGSGQSVKVGDAAAAAGGASSRVGASGGGGGDVGASVQTGAQAEGKKDSTASATNDESAGIMDFDDAEFDVLEASEMSATAAQGAGAGGAGGSGGPKPASAAAPAASETLVDELSELEQLEKELGIMGVVGDSAGEDGGSGGGGSGGGRVGADSSKNDDNFDMDNLDELEGYLESLAK
ncbi:unnamed protein product [Scytosiphon promiscuus]